jgi:hypothetical protein
MQLYPPCRSRALAALITGVTLLGSSALADAARQPMAVATPDVALEANGSAFAIAYCLDLTLDAPDQGTTLGHVSGEAKACYRGACVPLQKAIDDGVVRVTGSHGYRLSFTNLKPFPVAIHFERAVLSDAPVRVHWPDVELTSTGHSNLDQYNAWFALGQIGKLQMVGVTQTGDTFVVDGVDRKGRRMTFEGVTHSELSPLLTHFAIHRDLELEIYTDLPERSVETLIENLHLQSAAKGLVAAVNISPGEVSKFLGETAISDVAARTPDARTIEATCNMTTPFATLPAKLTVRLHEPETLAMREHLAEGVAKVMDHIPLGKRQSILSTAAAVRAAVKDEIKALRVSTNWSRDAIWLLIGDLAGPHLYARIPLGEDTWRS